MTDEEAQLVYDYLHEYFDYKDGELIVKKVTSSNKKIGDSAGAFITYFRDWHPYIKVGLPKYLFKSNKERQMPLSHCIYIYHYKKKSRYIYFEDGNHVNTKIENLIPKETAHFRSKLFNRTKKLKLVYERHLKSGTVYCVRGELDGKNIVVGDYKEKDVALKAAIYLNDLKYTGITPDKIKNKALKKYPHPRLKTNKTGFQGVAPWGNKFTSSAKTKDGYIKLSVWLTPEEDHEAYLKAKEEYKNELYRK